MSDGNHLAQALHVHHGLHHPHSLGHPHGVSIGLSHAHHAQAHELHHAQALAEAEAHAQAEAHAHGNPEHVHHGHHHRLQHSDESAVEIEDHEEDPGDEEGLDEAEMHSDGANNSDAPTQLAVRTGTTQLTLSYQGEVYVFDTVPPEKVQAVLLLLGGREIPPGMSGVGVAGHLHASKGVPELPARMNMPQRLASLTRFREKRKERCYDKKIRYNVRKEVAQRMQRKKGQFASSRSAIGDQGGPVSNWGNPQASDQQVGLGGSQQEVTCVHCGIGERSTPMMRRGPSGPRTLCNACGLMWANKGVLRDLSKNMSLPGVPQQPHILHQQQIIMQQQQQIAALQHSLEHVPQAANDGRVGNQHMDIEQQLRDGIQASTDGGTAVKPPV